MKYFFNITWNLNHIYHSTTDPSIGTKIQGSTVQRTISLSLTCVIFQAKRGVTSIIKKRGVTSEVSHQKLQNPARFNQLIILSSQIILYFILYIIKLDFKSCCID